jgi:hypothetical protein
MITTLARRAATLCSLTALVGLSACEGNTRPPGELRFVTETYVIRIYPETRPTKALEQITWRAIVHDRASGTPIQGGQGRIFATSKDRKSIANGLEATDELGTYRTKLMYVTAGLWAHAMEFRADSTQKLQRTEDWTQDVLTADEPGDFTPPSSSTPSAPATTTPSSTGKP